MSVNTLMTSVLNSASDRLAVSLSLNLFFWSFDLFFHLGNISLSQCICYIVWGGALGIRQVRVTHVSVVVALFVGEGSEREQ